MVYNLKVTLIVEYAEDRGREKLPAYQLGAGEWGTRASLKTVESPQHRCICQSLLQRANFFFNCQNLEQWILPRSYFYPQLPRGYLVMSGGIFGHCQRG